MVLSGGRSESLGSNTAVSPQSRSVFEGPVAAGFADEVLEELVVHVGEGLRLRLRHRCQVVHAELEAELLQVLQKPRAPTGKCLERHCHYGHKIMFSNCGPRATPCDGQEPVSLRSPVVLGSAAERTVSSPPPLPTSKTS